MEYCAQNNIPYLKLPLNPFLNNPSKSHGVALNWAYKHIIKKLKPVHFGFIDHDIIPFKETLITPFIINGIYGLAQERGEKWYLWPGFCFYKYKDIKKYKINFMPSAGLDTGGSNYYSLYKKIDKNNIQKPEQIYFDLNKKEKMNTFDNSNNMVEIIDNWVHLMRISGWNKEENTRKLSVIQDIVSMLK